MQAGYQIAQQNCFRCHNAGDEGGQKSGVTWAVLSARGRQFARIFRRTCANPKSKNPQAQMPGNPQYDDQTLQALTAYFETFRAAGEAMTLRAAKVLLVFAVAIFYSFVVFNNVTDYDSNYQFVRHVLMMDSTFPGQSRNVARDQLSRRCTRRFMCRSSRGKS